MKQLVECSYFMELNDSVEVDVLFHDGTEYKRFIILYYFPENQPDQWSVVTPDKYYDIDAILYELSEESYFQLSTVWKVPYNMEFITELQKFMIQDRSNWNERSESIFSFSIELEY